MSGEDSGDGNLEDKVRSLALAIGLTRLLPMGRGFGGEKKPVALQCVPFFVLSTYEREFMQNRLGFTKPVCGLSVQVGLYRGS